MSQLRERFFSGSINGSVDRRFTNVKLRHVGYASAWRGVAATKTSRHVLRFITAVSSVPVGTIGSSRGCKPPETFSQQTQSPGGATLSITHHSDVAPPGLWTRFTFLPGAYALALTHIPRLLRPRVGGATIGKLPKRQARNDSPSTLCRRKQCRVMRSTDTGSEGPASVVLRL